MEDCVVGAPVKKLGSPFFLARTNEGAKESAPFSYFAYNFDDGGVHRKVVRSRVHMRHVLPSASPWQQGVRKHDSEHEGRDGA